MPRTLKCCKVYAIGLEGMKKFAEKRKLAKRVTKVPSNEQAKESSLIRAIVTRQSAPQVVVR
jgi:hypothetical protein